jgi:hypothetical protein
MNQMMELPNNLKEQLQTQKRSKTTLFWNTEEVEIRISKTSHVVQFKENFRSIK